MSTPEQPSSPPAPLAQPLPQPPATSTAQRIAPIGIIVAGLLGLVGAVLPWVTTSISTGETSQSIDGPSPVDGSSGAGLETAVAVVLAALLLIAGAVYLFGGRRRLVDAAAGLSVVLFGFAIFEIIQVYRRASEFYHEFEDLLGSMSDDSRAQLPNIRDVFDIRPAPGLWLLVFAGLLGTVLSVILLLSRRTPVAPAMATNPPAAPPEEG